MPARLHPRVVAHAPNRLRFNLINDTEDFPEQIRVARADIGGRPWEQVICMRDPNNPRKLRLHLKRQGTKTLDDAIQLLKGLSGAKDLDHMIHEIIKILKDLEDTKGEETLTITLDPKIPVEDVPVEFD